MRPSSLSLMTNTNTSDSAFAMLAAGSASPSATAMLASLDPTSTVYDENSGGYGTPSYAGSYADDSSFEDRDLTLDFGSFTNFPLSDYDQQQPPQPQGPSQAQAQNQQPQPAASPGHPQQQPLQPLASAPQQPQQQHQGGQSPFASAFSHYQHPQGQGQYPQAQGQPVFGKTGADLYAFRDANRPPAANEWDSNSSIGGASGASPAHTGNLHSSPEMGAYQSSFSSSSFGGSGTGQGPVQEGNGLEMAVERMFAPLSSPQVLGATPSPPVPPVRDDTIRSSSVPLLDPRDDPAAPLFTASPNHSPRLEAQGAEGSGGPHLASTTSLPNVPTLSRLSPSPASPSFRNTHVHAPSQTQTPGLPYHPQPLRQLAHDVQPSLRSPPLPNGVAHSLVSDQARLVQLAPLAIPERPDLTLTTATPTAMPRTAITARQDSTQAALDTVFSTFFDRANRANRTVSADSRRACRSRC